MFDLTFIELVVVIVLIVVGIIAVRIVVTVDVNQWLNDRATRRLAKAQRRCPHVQIIRSDRDGIVPKGLLYSPRGTIASTCQQCGAQFADDGWYEANTRYWLNHLDEYEKATRHTQKLLR